MVEAAHIKRLHSFVLSVEAVDSMPPLTTCHARLCLVVGLITCMPCLQGSQMPQAWLLFDS